MLDQLQGSFQFDFWRSVACLAAGVAVVAPCLLVPTWRRRILSSDIDIEGIGLIVLVVAIVAVGCYNYFGAANGT